MFGDKAIKKIGEKLQSDFKSELREQGHYLTGSLENSIDAETNETGSGQALELSAVDYADPVNDGVPASRIPYDSSQTTGAKHSKYIEGLQNYAKLRMGISSDSEALGVAFAIAKKHEKEGMPTSGSYTYSTNGRRTEALEQTLDQNESFMNAEIEEGISDELDDFFDMDNDIII